jgi:hypothetical protein
MQNALQAASSLQDEAPRLAAVADPALLTLDQVVAGLRRLALAALDAGFPMPAAQIASTADHLELQVIRTLPPRAGYPRG